MGKEQYVAYVSTYTSGNKSGFGIRIYDVDIKNGRFTEKDQVKIIKFWRTAVWKS